MKNPFLENSGVFSWRKAGTAMIYFVFAFSVIGNQIANKFDEMPASYYTIIAGVFGFYFMKDVFRNVKITGKNGDEN